MKSQLHSSLMTCKYYVVFALILFTSISLNAQTCDSSLNAAHNLNTRSVDIDGTSFMLIIKNNSSEDTVYDLKTEFTNCSLPNNEENRAREIPLIISFSDGNERLPNKIRVPRFSEKRFLINLNQTNNTPQNTWSCIKVVAENNLCKSDIVFTTLKLFVPDPKEK